MTATNHVLAGAVVATSIQQPFLIIPIAFLSHFVLDILPHFGVIEATTAARNKNLLFRYILAIDIALTVSLLVLLPFILKGTVSWWVLITGMLLALAPDVVWTRAFFKEIISKTAYTHSSWLSKFHQRIQWFEKPWGLVTEVLWFGAMGVLLGILAK